ncbi:unnamed protein product [Microthlaspi erraticum]|uniref:Uncharacterized protein n=1 Tax=Microthlaspi erraticum TaxID=1685480 RepID=A0A6D2JLV6_9BRAS|nr:unnamed protein product [Microthlaspi erraticum]
MATISSARTSSIPPDILLPKAITALSGEMHLEPETKPEQVPALAPEEPVPQAIINLSTFLDTVRDAVEDYPGLVDAIVDPEAEVDLSFGDLSALVDKDPAPSVK